MVRFQQESKAQHLRPLLSSEECFPAPASSCVTEDATKQVRLRRTQQAQEQALSHTQPQEPPLPGVLQIQQPLRAQQLATLPPQVGMEPGA